MRKSRYRRCLIWTFWISLLFTVGFSYYYMERVVPDRIHIVLDQEETMQLALPLRVTLQSNSREVSLGNGSDIPSDQITITRNQPFSLYGSAEGSYRLDLDLFGLFRLKEIQVDVADRQYAVPCGAPVGIYLKSDGVMVIGTSQLTTRDGLTVDPAAGVLQSGDYIESINGVALETKEELARQVSSLDGRQANLHIRRQSQELDVSLLPIVTQEGDSKLGVWVRSDTQGIGTVTYLDLNGRFGALGHGISDSDTGDMVEIENGELYDTEIIGVEKGSIGNPGVMSGIIYYGPGSQLGSITANTDEGIFGSVNSRFLEQVSAEPLEIGYRQDIVRGPATIRSGVSGTIEDYDIEILRVDYSTTHTGKGLVIQVTDPRLLELTGGIVQGMSGSPIIQNGKLIGAVTHVFVQDSTKGYGIFVENMLRH